MSLYTDYLNEIETRKTQGLSPKPIDDGPLTAELIAQIKDESNEHRAASIDFLVYNTLPGTTSSAGVKAAFLKEIIVGDAVVAEITPTFAFELLSHMKGGPSVEVLLDLALGNDAALAGQAADVLKTQVFLYEADTDRLKEALDAGNAVAKDIIESYSNAEFFTKLPEVDEEVKVVTFIAGEGDISTDLLSPGNQAHSRADRELHGKCMITEAAQKEIQALKLQHPDKRVMLIAEKGTMGVGSSRMSGVNNVALWTGKQASPYVPFVNFAPVVAGTNGISPIFLTTVGVTGGIGVDLKNWVKKLDEDGNPIMNNDGDPILEERYSVATGTVLTINTKEKKLYNEAGDEELVDMSASFTPQKVEFMKAGSSYAIVFGKKLQTFACEALGIEMKSAFAPSKEVSHEGQGLTAVEKIFNANARGNTPGKVLHAGSDVRAKVNIVGSQDTTGLMTSQELEAMAATILTADWELLVSRVGQVEAGLTQERGDRGQFVTALQEEFEQEHAVPDPMLLCAGRRRPTPYAAKRLLQRRNCSEGPPLLPGWDAPAPRAAAGSRRLLLRLLPGERRRGRRVVRSPGRPRRAPRAAGPRLRRAPPLRAARRGLDIIIIPYEYREDERIYETTKRLPLSHGASGSGVCSDELPPGGRVNIFIPTIRGWTHMPETLVLSTGLPRPP